MPPPRRGVNFTAVFLARYSHFVYLVMAGVLLLALVFESQRGDRTNLVVLGVALAIAVAMFEIRRRQRKAAAQAPEGNDTPTPPTQPGA